MRKIIAAMSMTLDGFCDHTAGIVTDETHEHFNELLRSADTIIFGRVTYQMMESHWPAVLKNPTGNKATDDFAALIDNISKIVFSHTLTDVNWKNTTIKHELIKEEFLKLKEQPGKDIIVGSPSMIVAFTKLGLIDEYQINLQPIILGKGLTLFKDIEERIDLRLLKTKTFECGVLTLYYAPTKSI